MSAAFFIAPTAGLLGEPTSLAREKGERRTFEALERRGREIWNELGNLSLENMVGERKSGDRNTCQRALAGNQANGGLRGRLRHPDAVHVKW